MARRPSPREPHWHCCTSCKHPYEDACDDLERNRRCTECRLGNGWALLRRSREPRDCCQLHSRLTTKDDRAKYKLVGSSGWWQCRVCFRVQGYDPALSVHLTQETS